MQFTCGVCRRVREIDDIYTTRKPSVRPLCVRCWQRGYGHVPGKPVPPAEVYGAPVVAPMNGWVEEVLLTLSWLDDEPPPGYPIPDDYPI